MSSEKKSIALPLVLFILLCLILAAIVGYIVYLHIHAPAPQPVPVKATSEPTAEPSATPHATAVPEPTATPVPAAEATQEPDYPFREDDVKFWTEGALRLSGSYRSPTLSVNVRTVVDNSTYGRRVTYYVADVYVRAVTQLRAASCSGDFQRTGHGSVERTAKQVNALVAISGDYCGFHRDSLVIRNGEVYRKSMRTNMDVCLLLRDGTMETYRSGTITLKEILDKDPWQAWQFGPALLNEEGDARTSFASTSISPRNPRSCIGYVDPGHYVFVVVDGRQKHSRGLTLTELASLMETLGCRQAFNLDGGASAHFFWHDTIFNKPSKGGRQISDIIYVAKEDYPDSFYFRGKDGKDK
jgi:hypothetical protein